jgi:hypothetical protein
VFHSYVQYFKDRYCPLRQRSYTYPEGTPEALADPKHHAVLKVANAVTDNSIDMADDLISAGVCVSFENPHTSTLLFQLLQSLSGPSGCMRYLTASNSICSHSKCLFQALADKEVQGAGGQTQARKV